METDDISFNGQEITVTFTAQVVASGLTGSIAFKVAFQDNC